MPAILCVGPDEQDLAEDCPGHLMNAGYEMHEVGCQWWVTLMVRLAVAFLEFNLTMRLAVALLVFDKLNLALVHMNSEFMTYLWSSIL